MRFHQLGNAVCGQSTIQTQAATRELEYSTLENDIRLLTLRGKLDVVGKGQIETRFAAHCGGDKPRVIVDFTEVEFMASIGIQLLFINAKSIARRGGKIVIANPNDKVREILDITGVPNIIAIFPDLAAAQAALAG